MRKLFLMTVSATTILAAAAFCMQQTNGGIHSLFQIHTEAQADDGGETPPITEEEEEEGPENGGGDGWDGWKKGYKHVRVNDVQAINITWPPSVQIVFVDCCKKSSQMNACNTQMESPRCKYLTY